MNKIKQMTSELNRVLHSNTYQFEIDTEDYVFGFKETIRTRTKDWQWLLSWNKKLERT